MCVNYRSADRTEIESIIQADAQGDWLDAKEIWPGYTSPLIRRNTASGKRMVSPAMFGLVPHWSRDPKKSVRSTTNARSETVDVKPSFRTAWGHARFGLVPIKEYFEPNYESGKPVRWSIRRVDTPVFCIAGIWSWWKGREYPEGIATFSMLTMNCESHAVLRRFHAPGDEKRAICEIEPDRYDDWLNATPDNAKSLLRLPDPSAFVVAPSPVTRRQAS